MATQPLSYEATVEIAIELLREGRNPSASAVVARAQRGSKTTALKHLERWRESLDAHGFVMPAGVPESLSAPLERIWAESLRAASKVFDEERARLEGAREEAVEKARSSDQAAEEAETQRERLETEVARLTDRTEMLSSQLASATAERDEAMEVLKAAREAFEEERRTTQRSHDEALDRQAHDHQATLEALRSRIEDLEGQVERWQERYDDTEKYWLQEVANARHATEKANDARAADRDQFDKERRLLNEQLVQRGSEITRLENRLASATAHEERAKALDTEITQLKTWIERMTAASHTAPDAKDDGSS